MLQPIKNIQLQIKYYTMEAWVPLMTLWSWGGLVMRVRAERQQGGGLVGRWTGGP